MEQMYIPSPVEDVLETLHRAGHEAYVVGGCVRDALMGRVPGDYDVTTSALPEDTLRIFAGWRVVETGLQHGTVTVVHQGWNVEVTTFRIDGAYTDNRHPESVTFTRSLAEDMARRDFTVNAMAYAPGQGYIDLYGGREDLAKGVIRCVGCAQQRFREDGLRILRALRFSAVLGFLPAEDDGDGSLSTAEAIHAMQGLLGGISRERIHVELTKLLCGKAAASILRTYGDVLHTILPMLSAEDGKRYGEMMEKLPVGQMPCLHYAVLFSLSDKENMKKGVSSLKMSRQEERLICALWERIDSPLPDRYALRKLAGQFSFDVCRQWVFLLYAVGRIHEKERDALLAQTDKLEQEGVCCSLRELAVNGADLQALGYSGAAIGKILGDMLEAVLQDTVENQKNVLLSTFAKSCEDAAHEIPM